MCCVCFSPIGDTRHHRGLSTEISAFETSRSSMVAVGTPVARRPPHRSQRALLTHWAPPSGNGVRTNYCTRWRMHQAPRIHIVFSRSAHSHQKVRRSNPALSPDRGHLIAVPFRQRPSLHHLRQGQALFVRWLQRYYYAVRLLIHVHVHRSARAFMNRPGPVRA